MNNDLIICKRCSSENLIKKGKTNSTNKTIWKQKWLCKDCGLKFVGKENYVIENSFEKEFKYKHKKMKPINWSAYNLAQINEKELFLESLNEILDLFVFEQKGQGRPLFNPRDIIFGMMLKTYNKNSARRIISDLKIIKKINYVDRVPCYSTLMNYFNDKNFKPILEKIIELTSLPLKEIEEDFAADATGFSTSQFGRWFDQKFDKEKEKRLYRKAHVMTGVLSNIIVSCIVTKQDGRGSADTVQFKPLLHKTALNFKMKEVSADMAYSSRENLKAVADIGAIPYIPFKSNVTGGNNGLTWRKMWLYFKNHPQDFYECYHKRSNVESTFNMVKQKFGDYLMTKTFTANVNEILCKIIAHNICCLISAYYELNLKQALCTKAPNLEKIQIKL